MSNMLPPHPMQPLVITGEGAEACVRFRANKIVRYLLDHGGINLSQIVAHDFNQDELDHFYQLIGYTVSGYDELVGSNVISEQAAVAAAHAACAQFGTKYGRCLDEEGCPVHNTKTKTPKK